MQSHLSGGDTEIASPLFYSYTSPGPQGLRDDPILPPSAHFDAKLGEFVLPYDDLRTASSPEQSLMDFLQSTYEAGAIRANWSRSDLERSDRR